MLAGELGHDVVGVYPGPVVIVRQANGEMLHVHAHDVVLATGAAELHPVCEGNMLRGIYTAAAAELLRAAGVDLGVVATVDLEQLARIEGNDGRVASVVAHDGTTTPCDSVVVTSANSAPRDLLARMVADPHVTTVGPAAAAFELPPPPTTGIVCPCSKVTVGDLQMVWDKGFQHLELVKRASLCGTGTCQGSVCMPHLRAFVSAKLGHPAAPFTGRPASRQLTISEAAADMHLDPFRRTALHDEHLALGARMDRFGGWWRPWNYGNFLDEYWAVREGVSLGDVSTLGKMIVTGPDVVEALERIYPTTIHDIRPGRSRYVLLLNERGHLIDDGMVCREATDDGSDRFVLTFTSGGASFAEAWIRDWIETWDLDVHILDRTLALGAINVTGPLAAELLESPQSWWVPWVNLLGQYTDTGALVAASLLLASYPDGTVEHHPLAPQAASQPPQAVRPRQFPSANPDRQPDGTPGGNPIRAIHRAQLKPTRGPPTRAPAATRPACPP